MDEEVFKFAIYTAKANWILWRSDFEHHGDYRDLPVLSSQDRFKYFMSSYGVGRGMNIEQWFKIRYKIYNKDDLKDNIDDNSGAGIDKIIQYIDGENLGKRKSLISKLAAFARPDFFIAWDQFALRGITQVSPAHHINNNSDYSSYLCTISALLNAGFRQNIIELSQNNFGINPSEELIRRVFDVYLMTLGGRYERAGLPGPPP